ncbi:MAG: flagellar hook-associated protein FlgK [Sideroxydans sp.]|nr:flagellar hook-associated protein FlgK [Sideroxydans sp.]
MASVYNIGVSALKVAQAGISVTSHNIANANTPGYSRQEIIQGTQLSQNMGQGYFGAGADVLGVKRLYNDFLGAQVNTAQTSASNLSTQYDLSVQVSNLLGDANGGLSVTLQDFFGAVNTVANSPESLAARQTMIGSAQSLNNRMQTLDGRLTEIRDGLNGQIVNSVSLINSYAKQIASLNDTIVKAQAQSATGQLPNDLLDQRDYLLTQLSMEIGVTSYKQVDGSMDVFIGTGQTLVTGTHVSLLQPVASSTDISTLDLAFVSTAGSVSRIPANALQGGNLGGYLNFRDTVLDPARNSLGRIAIGIADTFNALHQQGIDLKGGLGGAFFSAGTPQVSAATTNTGNSVVTATISDSGALTTDDYLLQFDGTAYTLFNRTTNTAIQSFTPAALATPQVIAGTGITLQLAAGGVADVSGDAYVIRPTVAGARDFGLLVTDPSKIAAASPVRSNATISNLGNATIAQPTLAGTLPLDANLQQPVTITFTSATTFDVTGTGAGLPAVGVAYTPGGNISYNGWTTQITGTPVAGDTFSVVPNTNATTDGTNILKLAQLQTANSLINGTTSYQGAYGQLVSQVGTQTRELEVTSKAQTSILAQVTKSQQSVSGVNLDEEAANLLKYQQAYQAAAKAMAIAQTMFDSLLQLGG